MPDFAVIIPAAGQSKRFGGSASKLLQPLAARPVIAWTLGAFANRDDVRQIVVATTDPDAIRKCADSLENPAKLKICPGGTCRADSVRIAALACDPSIAWVAVHDAARPLVSQAVIDRTFQAALTHGAAAAALAVHLTIKQASGPLPARVKQTLARHDLWAMQTPQAMRRKDLLDAFASCPIPLDQVTDDVQLLELAGKPVWLVDGEERNLKITTPQDIQIAHALIQSLPG
jgi:2-C-methyl-D-erythritol 4-phosphate cytidylyltransferase